MPHPPSPSSLSRRTLLTAAAATLGAGCNQLRPTAPAEPVTILKATAYDDTLYTRVRELLQEQRLNVKGKRIVLKPNLVEFDPNTPINTHPRFVHAAFEAFRALGAANVEIAEGPGHRRDTFDLADAAGYFSTIPSFDNLFTDINLAEVERVQLPRMRSKLKELYLPKLLLGADLIVSLAKMKTHHWVGATLTMKNFFGTVPGGVYGWPKNILHHSGIDECIADLHAAFPRHFGLVDGIMGMQGNGPIQGDPKFAGVIVGGRSLPAVDATCARIMGLDPMRLKYIQLAVGRKHIEEGNIPQTGEAVAKVRTNFDLFGHFQSWRLPG